MRANPNRHLPDGFPGDRRVRPGQYFQLDIGLPHRNFIHIWLPEGVSADGEQPFFIPGGAVSGDWEIGRDGIVRCRRRLTADLAMESVVEEIEDGALLTMRLTNHSDRVLKAVSAQACVQLAAAPDLRDFGLERTFWRRRGAWARFEEIEPIEGGLCVFYRPSEPVDLPLIVVESSSGPYAAGLIFRGGNNVGGNCQGSIGCIHSMVPGADIAAGETRTLEGYLTIRRGGKDAVLERAQAFHHGDAVG